MDQGKSVESSNFGKILDLGEGFKMGDEVEGRNMNGEWLLAKIACANDDGTYTLDWDERDTKDQVKKLSELRKKGFKKGDEVKAVYMNGKWLPAKIARANDDGTYTLDWDDHSTKDRVKKLSELLKKDNKTEESKRRRKEESDKAAEKDREKNKDKGRDKSSDKDKSKEKDKDRSKDRGRDKDKDREKEKDRDREKDKEKEKERVSRWVM